MKIMLDEYTRELKQINHKEHLPKSIASIQGKVMKNTGKILVLQNIKFGIISDKKTLKIRKATSKISEIEIHLSENNKIFAEDGDYINLGISAIKSLNTTESTYEIINKKFYFKLIKN